MEFHEATGILPLDEKKVSRLASDIKKNGQQIPIEVLNGKVIHGRVRWLACQRLGLMPLIKSVSTDDPVEYVLTVNAASGRLSANQLSMMGARARRFYEDQSGWTSHIPQKVNGHSVVERIAKILGIDHRNILKATSVLKRSVPELIAAVDCDLISLTTAERASGRHPEEQRSLVDRCKRTYKKRGRNMPRPAMRIVEQEAEEEVIGERRGVGVMRANEAINCLIRIPKNDALRKRGFQVVTDWIRRNQ